MNQFNQDKTIWINDSEEDIKLKLYKEVAGGSNKMTAVMVEVKAGKQVSLPSIYDQSIRKERHGQVVGGLCPWLRKKGETKVNLLPELDYFARKKEQDMVEMAEKIQKQKALEEAAKLLAE